MPRDVVHFRPRVETIPGAGPLTVPAGPFPFLLESSFPWPGTGRFDFAGADPFLTFTAWPDRIEIAEAGRVGTLRGADPLTALEETLDRFRIEGDGAPFPFTGGAVGYLSYDLAPVIENVPLPPIDDLRWPLIQLAFYDRIEACAREPGAGSGSSWSPLTGRRPGPPRTTPPGPSRRAHPRPPPARISPGSTISPPWRRSGTTSDGGTSTR